MPRMMMYVWWVDSCGTSLYGSYKQRDNLTQPFLGITLLLYTDLFGWLKQKQTPLHLAVDETHDGHEQRTKKVQIFKLLCRNRADPFLKDKVCIIISLLFDSTVLLEL